MVRAGNSPRGRMEGNYRVVDIFKEGAEVYMVEGTITQLYPPLDGDGVVHSGIEVKGQGGADFLEVVGGEEEAGIEVDGEVGAGRRTTTEDIHTVMEEGGDSRVDIGEPID